MADNGKPTPVPAPASAVAAEPALAPLRKVPAKVVSPMDRLKAYLKEVPSIRARLVKVTEEQEEMLKRSKASVEAFDQATTRITALVKSWEEQNAGHDAPGPVKTPVPTPSAAPVINPVATASVAGTTPAPTPAGEGAESGG
jgi:hypothetical protein